MNRQQVESERQRLNALATEELRQADLLVAGKQTVDKTTRTKAEIHLNKAAQYRKEAAQLFSSEDAVARINSARAEMGLPEFELEERSSNSTASEALRRHITGEELRTYTPLTTTATGVIVPQQFEKQLVLTAMAAGPLVAGSPACSEVPTATGAPRKMPMSDDLANVGYIWTEGSSSEPAEAELTLGQVSMGTTVFSSGISVLSNELLTDAEWTVTGEKVLQKTLGLRLGRIQNSTFLPALITALGSNSSASVAAAGSSLAYGDLTNLVASVNAAYRYSDKAGFMMNSNTQQVIANLKDSQNRPLFRKILAPKPELMGYPVFVSDYADDVASGKNPILFGDFSYVFIRHVPGIEIQVMRQRFAEYFQTAFIAKKRADMQYAVPSTANSAIKMLHFA